MKSALAFQALRRSGQKKPNKKSIARRDKRAAGPPVACSTFYDRASGKAPGAVFRGTIRRWRAELRPIRSSWTGGEASMKDLYVILQVAPTATPEEIHSAYRRRALEL